MIQLLRSGLMLCLWLCSMSMALAQTTTTKTVARGSAIVLSAPVVADSYQWQVSSDGEAFVNLPDYTGKDLNFQVFAPAYYRVECTTQGNKTYGETTQVNLESITYQSAFESSGAHGFVEDKTGKLSSGIKMPEDRNNEVALVTKQLTEWTNANAVAAYYLHHPKAVVDTKMLMNVTAGKTVSFCLKVYNPSNLKEPIAVTYPVVTGKGGGAENELEVFLIGLSFPEKGYYRYRLECLSGCQDIISINKFKHESPSAEKTYKPAYLSSPSVHLNNWRSTAPNSPGKQQVYDWCYMEVMMPKESDIAGTYIMSLGLLDGYMGIQQNGIMEDGRSRHDIIFSMWDKGNVDDNPNLPDNLRANIVDINPLAKGERFNNEGTGMKTFMGGHYWECDQFVQFIASSRTEMASYKTIENGQEVTKEQENTLVSAWFNARDGKGWQYIATLRLPAKHVRFDSWYSFLENYNYPTGQMQRKGFYRNGYGHTSETANPGWYHFNQVGLGHTDGGDTEGKRNDYGQGATDEYQGEHGEQAFFMTTGGFVSNNVTADYVKLNTNHTAVDTIKLDVLAKRFDQAIEHEKQVMAQKEYLQELECYALQNLLNKSGWEVIDKSSEETSGEGDVNGRASLIIDGKKETYWHSKWNGGGSSIPHFITVDMKDVYRMDAMTITMSGGTNRYIKSFDLQVSLDNQNWKTVYTDTDAPNQETFSFVLNKPIDARYFKIEITKSRANDGDHTRINEVEVSGELLAQNLAKTGWKVIDKSSEASTSQENGNGPASLIIDGKKDTYWHSGYSAHYPHHITVDMNDVYRMEAMTITMSGGERRYIESFNLQASLDNQKWEKVYETAEAPNQETFSFKLNNPTNARYFKIVITKSRANDGDHTRINEVEVEGKIISRNLDKKTWAVTDKSSEETQGEGSTNGRAALIIDGDKNTYWHSQYNGGQAKYPHHITVDMKEAHKIESMEITMSGTNRYIQKFDLETSMTGNSNWVKVYSSENVPNQSSFRFTLPHPVVARFFKIVVRQSQAGNAVHTRINEVEVFESSLPEVSKKQWKVVGFSSEQRFDTDGKNGPAEFIIDGKKDTYWHSEWTPHTATYPHFLTVDMNNIYLMKDMTITMSGGEKRYIKAFNLKTSLDKENWEKVYETTDAPNQETFTFGLNQPTYARYFKLEITESREDVHTCVNEISISGDLVDPSLLMKNEATERLNNPNAHNVGYPAREEYNKIQKSYDALSSNINDGEAGAGLREALDNYAVTPNIELPENDVVYTLSSVDRGSLSAHKDGTEMVQSTKHSSMNLKPDFNDTKQQFTFVTRDGKTYLYSCHLKKYMNKNNTFSNEPADPVILVKNENYFSRLFISFGPQNNFNFGRDNQITIDKWDTHDNGNAILVENVGVEATLKSTFGAMQEAGVATFSAPYSVKIPEGVTAYYTTEGESSSSVRMNAIQSGSVLPANSGVLIAGPIGKTYLIKAAADAECVTLEGNLLRSTAKSPVLLSTGDYILTKGSAGVAFYPVSDKNELRKYRSYLHLDKSSTSILMDFGAVTGIGKIEAIDSEEAPVYDLSGRRVQQITKGGIYICNGKKFLVK